MGGYKKQRVAEMVYALLAEEVRKLAEEGSELISLSSVDMSPDLKTAWIYWSIMELGNVSAVPSPDKIAESENFLELNSNYFKQRIARELKLRYTPKLVFKYDHSFEYAAKIDELMKKVGSTN